MEIMPRLPLRMLWTWSSSVLSVFYASILAKMSDFGQKCPTLAIINTGDSSIFIQYRDSLPGRLPTLNPKLETIRQWPLGPLGLLEFLTFHEKILESTLTCALASCGSGLRQFSADC